MGDLAAPMAAILFALNSAKLPPCSSKTAMHQVAGCLLPNLLPAPTGGAYHTLSQSCSPSQCSSMLSACLQLLVQKKVGYFDSSASNICAAVTDVAMNSRTKPPVPGAPCSFTFAAAK
eukprot:6177148-Pleurochrysis_carterae.AAC.5